jgi:prepilin-type N-terminal cleavage/methylation domain-containing protein
MTGMQNKNSNTPRTGFTAIELIITVTVLAIVTGFGIVGITRARSTIRLSGAAREFASHLEKARLFSIRSHADDATERASITINDDKASYNVTLDLNGDGVLDTTTVTLPDGVTFDSVETIAFDWRGRTWSTVGGITSSNAQVSFRLQGGGDIVSIDITGSGDVTVDSLVFDDSVPNVNLTVADLASGATPSTTTPVTTTPVTTTPTTPVGTTDPTSTTPTDPTTTTPTDPTTTTPTDPTTTTPTDPTTTNPTTPTTPSNPTTTVPAVCTITTNPTSLSLGLDGTTTIKVSHDATTSLSISASSSKASDLQVTGGNQTVAAGETASFIVKSKKTIGIYALTFSTSCGSKTVTVAIAGIKLL